MLFTSPLYFFNIRLHYIVTFVVLLLLLLQRDASIADFYAQNPRALFQNVSAQSTNPARVPASTRVAQSRRNFNGPEMDLEMVMLCIFVSDTIFETFTMLLVWILYWKFHCHQRMISELRRSFTSAQMDLETVTCSIFIMSAAFFSEVSSTFLHTQFPSYSSKIIFLIHLYTELFYKQVFDTFYASIPLLTYLIWNIKYYM